MSQQIRDGVVDNNTTPRLHRFLFMGMTIGGALFIILSKYFGVRPELVAVISVVIMTAYAVMAKAPNQDIDAADNVGDNCYYMGLIFTLCSLAYAIFKYSSGESVDDIIQSFGVALASTIWGIVLRVFFNQAGHGTKQDEQQVRDELVESLRHLRDNLRRSRDTYSNTAQTMATRTEEFTESLQESLGKYSNELTLASGATLELASAIREQLSANSAMFGNHNREAERVISSTRELQATVAQLNESVRSVENLVIGASKMCERASNFATNADNATKRAADNIKRASESSEAVQSVFRNLRDELDKTRAEGNAARQSVNSDIQDVRDSFKRMIKLLEDAAAAGR